MAGKVQSVNLSVKGEYIQVIEGISDVERMIKALQTLQSLSRNNNATQYWGPQQKMIESVSKAAEKYQYTLSHIDAASLVNFTNALKSAYQDFDVSSLGRGFEDLLSKAESASRGMSELINLDDFRSAFSGIEESIRTLETEFAGVETKFVGARGFVQDLFTGASSGELISKIETLNNQLVAAQNRAMDAEEQIDNLLNNSDAGKLRQEIEDLNYDLNALQTEKIQQFADALKRASALTSDQSFDLSRGKKIDDYDYEKDEINSFLRFVNQAVNKLRTDSDYSVSDALAEAKQGYTEYFSGLSNDVDLSGLDNVISKIDQIQNEVRELSGAFSGSNISGESSGLKDLVTTLSSPGGGGNIPPFLDEWIRFLESLKSLNIEGTIIPVQRLVNTMQSDVIVSESSLSKVGAGLQSLTKDLDVSKLAVLKGLDFSSIKDLKISSTIKHLNEQLAPFSNSVNIENLKALSELNFSNLTKDGGLNISKSQMEGLAALSNQTDISSITSALEQMANKLNDIFEKMSSGSEGASKKVKKAFASLEDTSVRQSLEKLSTDLESLNLKMRDIGDKELNNELDTITEKLDDFWSKVNTGDVELPDFKKQVRELATELATLSKKVSNFTKGENLNAKLDALSLDPTKFAAATKQISSLQAKIKSMLSDFSKAKGTANYQGLEELNTRIEALRQNMSQMSSEDFQRELAEISVEAENFSHGIREAGDASQSFGTKLGNAIKQYASMFTGTMAITKIVQGLKQMVSATIELDSAMTQLKIVTKATDSELSAYSDTIIQTANNTATAVKDVVDAMTTYARLGFDIYQSTTLADLTAQLQNVGNIDASPAQDAVTAIVKAFGFQVDDMESIMDRLVKVGNAAPISVSQLAEGLNNTAAILSVATDKTAKGFEQSVALLTSANTTIQNISKSSTALRTIVARIRKVDTELDELGEVMTSADYDKLTRAITDQSVALVDEQGELRNTYDVLKDLSEAWKDMSANERASLAQMFGSTRNQNVFTGLMENFNEATDAMRLMEESEGSLASANAVYLDSIQAHIQTLKNTFDTLIYSEGVTDFIKQIVDLGTSLLRLTSFVSDVVSALGGLPNVLIAIAGAIAIFKGDAILDKFATSFSSIIASITAHPIIAGLAAATTLIVGVATAIHKAHEEMLESARKSASELNNTTEAVNEYKARAYELRTELDEGNLSEGEARTKREELLEIEDKLVEALGREAEGIKLITGDIQEQLDAIDELEKSKFDDWLNGNRKAIDELTKEYSDFNPQLFSGIDSWQIFLPTIGDLADSNFDGQVDIFYDRLQQAFDSAGYKIDIGDYLSIAGTSYDSGLGFLNGVQLGITDIHDYRDTFKDLLDIITSVSQEFFEQGLFSSQSDLNKFLGNVSSLYKEAYGVADEWLSKNGELINTYAQGMLSYNDAYSETWEAYLINGRNIRESFAEGDDEALAASLDKARELQTELTELVTSKGDQLILTWLREQFSADNIGNLDLEVPLDLKLNLKQNIEHGSGIKDFVINTLESGGFLNDRGEVDLNAIVEIQDLKAKNELPEMLHESEVAFNTLAAAAQGYGYVIEDGTGDVESFIQALIDLEQIVPTNKFDEFRETLSDTDIKEWFDSLSESDKQIVFDIYANAENATWTLDELQRKFQAVQDGATIASHSYANFQEMITDADDGGFSKYINDYIKNVKDLQSALDKIDKDEISSEDLVNLALNFPSLAPYIDDTDELRQNIVQLISATGMRMDGFLDYIIEICPEAEEEINSMRGTLLGLADTAREVSEEVEESLFKELDTSSASSVLHNKDFSAFIKSYTTQFDLLKTSLENGIEDVEAFASSLLDPEGFWAKVAEDEGLNLSTIVNRILGGGEDSKQVIEDLMKDMPDAMRSVMDDIINSISNPSDRMVVRQVIDNLFKTIEQEIESKSKSLRSEIKSLFDYSQEGGVNLLIRPEVDNSALRAAGYDVGDGDFTRVFAQAFSNEDNTVAINLTPVITDGKGNIQGILTKEELRRYAQGVLEGGEDYLKLQIGTEIDAEDAMAKAQEVLSQIQASAENFYVRYDGGKYSALISELSSVAGASDIASAALQKLNDSISQNDPTAGLEARIKKYEEMVELAEKGQTGALFQDYAEFFGIGNLTTEEQLQWLEDFAYLFGRTMDDNGKYVYNAAQGLRNFLDTISEGQNDVSYFADGVEHIYGELIHIDDETQDVTFDPSLLFDDQKMELVKQKFGVTREFLIDYLNELSAYDRDFQWFDGTDFEDQLFDAGLIEKSGDALVVYKDQITAILSAIGLSGKAIDDFYNTLTSLGENEVHLGLDNVSTWIQELTDAGVASENFVDVISDALEGYSPEIQASVIATISEQDSELGGQLEEIFSNETATVDATEGSNLETVAEKVKTTEEALTHIDENEWSVDLTENGVTEINDTLKEAEEHLENIQKGGGFKLNEGAFYGSKKEQKDGNARYDTQTSSSGRIYKQSSYLDTSTFSSGRASKEIDDVTDSLSEFGDTLQEVGDYYNSLTNGNVDYNLRPLLHASDMLAAGWDDVGESMDEVFTTYSSGFHTSDFGAVTDVPFSFSVTPILEDGTVLSPQALEDYVASLNLTDGVEEFLESDNLNLVINVREEEEWDESYWSQHEEELAKVKSYYEYIRSLQQEVESGESPIAPQADIQSFEEAIQQLKSEIESEDFNTSLGVDLDESESSIQDFADNIESKEILLPVSLPEEINNGSSGTDIIRSYLGDEWADNWEQGIANVFANIDQASSNTKDGIGEVSSELSNLNSVTVDEASNTEQIQSVGDAASTSASNVGEFSAQEDALSQNSLNLEPQALEFDSVGGHAGQARQEIMMAGDAWQAFAQLPDITKTITIQQSGNISASAKGTKSAKGGLTLLGDEYNPAGEPRPELVVSNGEAFLAGVNGPVISNLEKGAVVYPYKETKKILKNNVFKGSLSGVIPAFSGEGNASYLYANTESQILSKSSDGISAAVYNDYSTNSVNYDVDIDSNGNVTEASTSSAFAELIKNQEFKSFVDEFLNASNKLQDAFDKLAEGADGLEVYDELFKYFQEDAEALQILGARSEITADQVRALSDLVKSRVTTNFNAQFGQLSTEEDIAALQNYMNAVLEMGEVVESALNIKSFEDKMNELFSAIKESVEATGMSTDAIAAIQARYKGLEGFDPSVLFEYTANGVHMNTTALRELEAEYQNLQKSKIKQQLKDLQTEYKRLTKEIDSYADGVEDASKADLYAQRDKIQDQINDVEMLASQYDGLTSAFEKWERAQSMGEEGDLYVDLATNLEDILDLYEQGLIGTNKFRAAVQLMTNQDVSTWSAQDLATQFEKSMKTIATYFTENETGVKQFLEDVRAINDEWAYIDENGLWHIDIDDNELANILDINVESIQAIMRRLSDYGFDVKIDPVIDTESLENSIEGSAESGGEALAEGADAIANSAFNLDDSAYSLSGAAGDLNNASYAIKDAAQFIRDSADYLKEVKDAPTTVGAEVVEKAESLAGTAQAQGSAFAGGNWGMSGSGTALGGELGPEILVRNGRWYLLGENGAEFFNYRSGDIIFSHEQTKKLLEDGKLNSGKRRGTAVAEGSAFSTGVGVEIAKSDSQIIESIRRQIEKGKNNKSKSGSDSSSSSQKTVTFERIDWIEVAVNRLSQAMDRLKKVADSAFKTLKERLTASTGEIANVRKQIDLQTKAYSRYMKEADSIKLSASIKQLVRDGAVDIKQYDDDTRELINQYSEWYNKAIDAKDAIDELHESLKELYQERFENIQSDFENQLGVFEAQVNALSDSSYATLKTNNANESEIIKNLANQIVLLGNEANELNEALDEAVNSGGIKKYSEAWYEMQSSIQDVRQNILDAYEDMASAYEAMFQNIEKTYSNEIDLYSDQLDALAESSYRAANANNKNASASIGLYRSELSLLNQELADLTKARDAAVNSGTIKKGSDAWYGMQSAINEVNKSIREVHENVAATFEQIFDTVESHYSQFINRLSNLTDRYNTQMSIVTEKGYVESTKFYDDLTQIESKNLQTLQQEMVSLQEAMNNAMDSGEIEKYSDSWYDMQSSIDDTASAIDKANLQLIKYSNSMRELSWSYFDMAQKKIEELNDEADFLIDLLDNREMYEDNGQFNNTGTAVMGLRAQNYEVAMEQSKRYASEILNINKQLAKDPYNTKLLDRRQELLKLQRQSILAAESEKDAIKSLVEEGINKELSSMKDLIDAYTNSLNETKSLYDYQKNVAEQTENIARLRKQMSALSGDVSEETRARVQKLQVELSDAEEQLQQTEYEQFITDATKLLDNMYNDYESMLNARLDDVDGLLSEMIGAVNDNSKTIWSTITESANNVGYQISTDLQTVWGNTASLETNVVTALSNIDALIQAQIMYSGLLAEGMHNGLLEGASILKEDASAINATLGYVDWDINNRGSNIESGLGQVVSTIGSNADMINGTLEAILASVNQSLNVPTTTTAKKATATKTASTATKKTTSTASKSTSSSSNISTLKSGSSKWIYTGHDYEKDTYMGKPIYRITSNDGEIAWVGQEEFEAIMSGKKDVPTNYVSYTKASTLSSADILNSIKANTTQLPDISKLQGLLNSGAMSGQNVAINIGIDKVQDYNDFVKQLANDPQAEKLIQAMGLNQLASSASSLRKYGVY